MAEPIGTEPVLRIVSVWNDQFLSGGEPRRCPFMNKIIIVASKEN